MKESAFNSGVFLLVFIVLFLLLLKNYFYPPLLWPWVGLTLFDVGGWSLYAMNPKSDDCLS